MANQKSFTGVEFIKALAEKRISEPVVLEGMAKLEDGDATSFMFSPGTSCTAWTRIPADLVEQVVLIRVVTCKDHTHPFVRLHLKEPAPDNAMASLFVAFVKQAGSTRQRPAVAQRAARGVCYGYDSGCPSYAPCAEDFDGDTYCTDCCIAATSHPTLLRQERRAAVPPRRRGGASRVRVARAQCWNAYVSGNCGDGGYMSGEDTDPSRDVAYANALSDAQYGCYNRGGFIEDDVSYEFVNC